MTGTERTPAEQPTTVTLPVGWESGTVPTPSGQVRYWRVHIAPHLYLYATSDGVEDGDRSYLPDEARSMAARLVEAADIAEQLHGGAR